MDVEGLLRRGRGLSFVYWQQANLFQVPIAVGGGFVTGVAALVLEHLRCS